MSERSFPVALVCALALTLPLALGACSRSGRSLGPSLPSESGNGGHLEVEAGAPMSLPNGVDAGTCILQSIGRDATLQVEVDGGINRFGLFGVEVSPAFAAQTVTILERIRTGKRGKPPRCLIRQANRMTLTYFAWQDKSGDVWEDAAGTLLDQGLAVVMMDPFPERALYLAREEVARREKRGRWARP